MLSECSAKDGPIDSGGRQNTGPADHQRIAKLDREKSVFATLDHAHTANLKHIYSEVAPPETIDRELGKVISQARLGKEPSMTQKDLGQKINETATVIQSYENGKAVPSPQVLAKMERVSWQSSCSDFAH